MTRSPTRPPPPSARPLPPCRRARTSTIAAGIAQFYAARGYLPVWTADGKISDPGKAIIARLAAADADGLSASDYKTPSPTIGDASPANLAALADAEVALSAAIVTYARQAYAGRLVPGDLSPNIGWAPKVLDPASVLASVSNSDEPAVTLAGYNPQQPEFAKLRDKLAELRAEATTKKPIDIPPGPVLKPGMTDARVVLLRQRFDLPTEVAAADVYDPAVLAAVKAFQKSAQIKP